jgi:hypothetical protein
MRFGLDDGYAHTLEEVGYVFKLQGENQADRSKGSEKIASPHQSSKSLKIIWIICNYNYKAL